MAIAATNLRSVTGLSGIASTTLTYLGAVTAGSALFGGGWIYNAAGAGALVMSDSVNGAWTVPLYRSATFLTNCELGCGLRANTGAGTPVVTFNPAGGAADVGGWFIGEATGAATASASDVNPTSESAGTATPSQASGSLAQADELLIAIVGVSDAVTNAITADATYTAIVMQPDNVASVGGQAQYKVVASTASDTADWTLASAPSNTWQGVLSIKGLGGAAAAVSFLSLLGVGS